MSKDIDYMKHFQEEMQREERAAKREQQDQMPQSIKAKKRAIAEVNKELEIEFEEAQRAKEEAAREKLKLEQEDRQRHARENQLALAEIRRAQEEQREEEKQRALARAKYRAKQDAVWRAKAEAENRDAVSLEDKLREKSKEESKGHKLAEAPQTIPSRRTVPRRRKHKMAIPSYRSTEDGQIVLAIPGYKAAVVYTFAESREAEKQCKQLVSCLSNLFPNLNPVPVLVEKLEDGRYVYLIAVGPETNRVCGMVAFVPKDEPVASVALENGQPGRVTMLKSLIPKKDTESD